VRALFATVTREAARTLEDAARGPGFQKVLEKDLEAAIVGALRSQGAEAEHNKKIGPIPHWDPQPGPVDVAVLDGKGRPCALAELKWCNENKVFEALWDLLKMAAAADLAEVEETYLIYGAPQAYWDKPVECAQEIFDSTACDLPSLTVEHWGWWRKYILGDSTGRPLEAPQSVRLSPVATAPLKLAGTTWEIRTIAIEPNWSEPTPYYAGFPQVSAKTAAIERFFNEDFSRWNIGLAPDVVRDRQAGHIYEQGWHIGFVWGEDDGDIYLEFLAQHRMTDDSRRRVFSSGRVEDLPAPYSMFLVSEDPKENREQERVFVAENARLYAELRETGLLPPAGENLLPHEIKELLTSGKDPDDSPDPGDSAA
jgi:hypothetical protein